MKGLGRRVGIIILFVVAYVLMERWKWVAMGPDMVHAASYPDMILSFFRGMHVYSPKDSAAFFEFPTFYWLFVMGISLFLYQDEAHFHGRWGEQELTRLRSYRRWVGRRMITSLGRIVGYLLFFHLTFFVLSLFNAPRGLFSIDPRFLGYYFYSEKMISWSSFFWLSMFFPLILFVAVDAWFLLAGTWFRRGSLEFILLIAYLLASFLYPSGVFVLNYGMGLRLYAEETFLRSPWLCWSGLFLVSAGMVWLAWYRYRRQGFFRKN